MSARTPGIRPALAVGAALLTLCALGAGPGSAQHSVAQGASVDADAYLKIWNLNGSVRVSGWARDSVHVEGTMDAFARREFFFGASGGAGKLGVGSEGGGAGVAELHVRVPTGATVWIKTSSAPVRVAGMRGSVDVYSVTGDVEVAGSMRSLSAESMGGDLVVRGDAALLRLKSGSGAIRVQGAHGAGVENP